MSDGEVEILCVSVKDAARMLGVRPPTIRQMIDRGRLRGFRVGPQDKPRTIRVGVQSIEAYLQEAAINP